MQTYHVAVKSGNSLHWTTVEAESFPAAMKLWRERRNGANRWTNPYAFYPAT